MIILRCVANSPCPLAVQMAILRNGSATPVHLLLAQSASENGKPPSRPMQHRLRYGNRERPKGDVISKK